MVMASSAPTSLLHPLIKCFFFLKKKKKCAGKKLFALCDADGDGKITSSEFHAAMIGLGKECTEEKCAEMVKTADVDGDGYLSFEEFMVTIIGEF